MKKIIQEIYIYSFALYVTTLLLPGIKIIGGLESIILGGIILAVAYVIVKPLLNVFTLPLNFITVSLFSFALSVGILYAITKVYTRLRITEFEFPGFNLYTIDIKPFHVSLILSYIIISVTIYLISKLLTWLFES